MKKRILFLPSWYPDTSNPLNGIFIHEQAVILSKKYDVAVLTVQVLGWRKILLEKEGFAPRFNIVDGINIYMERGWVPIPRTPWVVYHAFVAAVRRGMKRISLEWGRPDLLHTHVVLPMGNAAEQVGFANNIPTILTEHTSPFSFHLQTRLQRRLVATTLRKASAVVAVSPSLANTIQSFVPDVTPTVIGELVRADFFTPISNIPLKPAGQPFHFLTVCFLVEQKGISVLLNAASILFERGITDFEIVIGGDGPLRIPLEKLAKELHLKNQCRFIGVLDRMQVRDEMRNSDVFILPSLHETFGIVLAEAMACGKPVIATHCGGPEYVVTPETGLLVEPGDPLALAEAMEHFVLRRIEFDADVIRQSVLSRFGEDAFLSKMNLVYEDAMQASNR
jgi:L-malate glycosyltransferase